MANPFSGLENIGQSYLQGVQLANQRQYREEAAAQRAEDTRVRERYYQDLVDQRREAATLTAQNRADVLGSKFAEHLTLNPDGSVNLVESSRKLKEAEGQDAFNETAGLAESLGAPIGEVDKKIRGTKAFQKGLALGIVKKMENETAYNRILASQGMIAMKPKAIPADLEPTISGPSQDTEFNVLNEIRQTQGVPETLVQPPAMTAPEKPAKGYQYVDIGGGRTVLMKAPKVEKVNVDRPYTVNILDDAGKIVETIKMSAEERDAYRAKQLSKPSDAPASTNAAPVGRLSYDQNAPFGAVYTPLKY